ncbi:MAG: TaqI-like C-terminal specificity domain-containing protein, partial [Patescibacteria group bacterium]|nr:TaqI-like C-terminal specificity domain-containing protein [Patescibacteria group bacterium]
KGEWVHFTKAVFDNDKKIVWRQTADTINAALMNFQAYFGKTIHAGLIKDKYKNKVDIYYALAIFNSKYIDYIYRHKVAETGKVFPQVKLKYLRDLPFVVGDKEQQKELSSLAKRMIKLNKQLQSIPENSDKWNSVKKEIEKVDGEIDERVYKLYDLTLKEREAVDKIK